MDDREKLITANFGLVHSCAARFKGRGIEYEDLFQIGCIGLIKAADGFDESRGLKFSTYAVPTILGEIKRIFRDTGAVKVSRALKELAFKAVKEKECLEKNSAEEIGVAVLAEKMGVEPTLLAEALCCLQPTVSLTSSEDSAEEFDLPIQSEESAIGDRLLVQQLMENLSQNEKQLIKLRFFGNKTQSETAKMLSMTQVQVSRAEKKILIKLRDNAKEESTA